MQLSEYIPYGRQSVSEEDIVAVVEVLRSDYLTQGPAVPRFEAAIAAHVGVKHAVAVNSATSALHLACLTLGLGPGDVIWTSPNTFVASANCGRYCGARVDFVDIDPDTLNLSPDVLEKKLQRAARDGALPKIVIPVHFAGQSCDMARIKALANHYDFRIIEDASHAIGGSYKGAPIGDCRHSDMAVFSFHPVKIVTTGEGGMLTTNDALLAEKLRLLRSHGITRDPAMMGGDSGPWYYEQLDLGYNYRMTDIQAALGCSQMQRLDEFVTRRRQLADRYDRLLTGLPIRLPFSGTDSQSAWHLYVVRLDDPKRRSNIFKLMRLAGIGVNVHYIPVHTQPYYRNLGFGPGDYPNAEAYYSGAISLPMYSGLSDTQQDKVVACLKESLA